MRNLGNPALLKIMGSYPLSSLSGNLIEPVVFKKRGNSPEGLAGGDREGLKWVRLHEFRRAKLIFSLCVAGCGNSGTRSFRWGCAAWVRVSVSEKASEGGFESRP